MDPIKLAVGLGVASLVLMACGNAGSSPASSPSTSAPRSAGSPPPCSAREQLSGTQLIIDVNVPGPAVAYVNVAQASPPSQSVTIQSGQPSGRAVMNDSRLDPAQVTVYANQKSSTCTAIPR